MFAIATQLDQVSSSKTRVLWDWLETNCGLSGIRLTPLPHFSWQGAESYEMEGLKDCLDKITGSIQPFEVNASGLGIFTGLKPILYIALVKTRKLMELHELLWESTRAFYHNANLLYFPSYWVPHITLAYQDLSVEGLACAIKVLSSRPFDMSIFVNNLSVIYANNTDMGVAYHSFFGGTSNESR